MTTTSRPENWIAMLPLNVGRPGGPAPAGWKWRSLAELARLESGHTPSRSRPDWWGGDIPWIALPDIRRLDGQVAMSTTETTNDEGIKHSAARVLPAGTVVLSRTASVGFVTRMGRPMATSQDFVNWVCGPDLDPEFLMYLLIRCREFVRSLSSGAIHKTVYFPTVEEFWVCAPPLQDQRRIADGLRSRLELAGAVRSSADQQLRLAEQLSSALLARAFERERERERVRLRELVSWPFETWNPRAEPAVQFDYVDIASIENGTKSIGATRRLIGALAPSRARRRVRVDDVLVSTTRPALNAVAMVPRELDRAVCSTGLAVLRADSRVIPRYLWYWVRAPEFAASLARAVAGALYPAVTDRDVLDQMMPLPNLNRQAQIIEDLDARLASAESIARGIQARRTADQALPLALLCNAFRFRVG